MKGHDFSVGETKAERFGGCPSAEALLEWVLDTLREGDAVIACKLDSISCGALDLEPLANAFKDMGVTKMALFKCVNERREGASEGWRHNPSIMTLRITYHN